jgi:hypothetical protein
VFGAGALEHHDQVALEEDDRVDRGPTKAGIVVTDPLAHERQVEVLVEIPLEVILGHEGIERDGDGEVELAGFGRAEHGKGLRSGRYASETPGLPRVVRNGPLITPAFCKTLERF